MSCKKSSVKRLAALVAAAAALALPMNVGAVTVPAGGSLIDDCEGGTNENKFHQYWYCYDDNADGGNSTISNYTKAPDGTGSLTYVVTPIPGEGNGGTAGYRIDYAKGTKAAGTGEGYRFVGIGTMLAAKGQTLNITGATKITFWAKAVPDAQLNVEIATSDITDFAYFHMTPLPVVTGSWAKYEMVLIKGTGVAQPATWGIQKTALDLTKAQKIQWQLHWDNTVPTSGKFWVDDVVIENYTFNYVPAEACLSCVTAVGSQPSPSALFSDFETTPVNRNAAGLYWYCYNDAKGRTITSQLDYSDITSGAIDTSLTTPPLLQIGPTGQGGGNAATIEYQLGPSYKEGNNTVKPFVGIGSSLSDNLGTMFYNATRDGATGVYFEYQATGVPYLRLEVQTNQVFPNAGIVFHRLLPATTGAEWKAAKVMFADLMLPDWAEVTALAPSAKIIKLDEIKQIQWAAQGDPQTIGKISIDNVYLIGATKITQVGAGVVNHLSPTVLGTGISARMVGSSVVVDVSKAAKNTSGTVAVLNAKGSVVAMKNLGDAKAGFITLNTANAAKGMYFLKLNVAGSRSMTVPVSLF